MMAKNRYVYLDVLRVAAISFVVLLHCICNYFGVVDNCVYSPWKYVSALNEIGRIGVPLFFMISGFLMFSSPAITSIGEFYKKRFIKIGIPFLIYDVFYYFYFHITQGKKVFSFDFIKEFLECGSAYHLWFIYSILILYLFVPFIKMIVDRCNRKQLILFFVLSIFLSTIRPMVNIAFQKYLYFFLSDDGMIGYMGYMLLGYILGEAEIKIKPIYAFGIVILLIIGFSLQNVYFGIKEKELIFNNNYYINHYLEAAFLFLGVKNINKIPFEKLWHTLSKITMSVYFIHVLILDLLLKALANMPMMISYSVSFVITLVLSFGYGYLIDKVKTLKKDKVTV